MKEIVQDFKFPDVPEGQNLGKTLNNVAFGEQTTYPQAWPRLC